MTAPGPALELRGVSKRFGSTLALDDVNLDLTYGSIRALLGHNGSGKSTLVKILAGYHEPDSGVVRHNGEPLAYPISQLDLANRGITFLHQDIGLVESASVLDNVYIGRYKTNALGQIKKAPARRHVRELVRELGASFSPDAVVGGLSASERTIVGLARAMHDLEEHTQGVLVLDEATASLPAREVDELLSAVRSVAARGIAVLLVTHHLNEPVALADEVTVLRDGRVVADRPVEGLDERALAELVIGNSRTEGARRATTSRPGVRAEVRALTRERVLRPTDFAIAPGEIVGLTGLSGSGHDTVAEMLFGLRRSTGGTLVVNGAEVAKRPAAARRAGVALVSGDRARFGGVIAASLSENVGTPNMSLFTGRGHRIDRGRERAIVGSVIERFDVRPGRPSAPFASLSGGNQQKALLGRFLIDPPQLLLLDEPTSGVDIGAVDAIIDTLSEYAAQGGAVIIASTQYEDLARLADRVLVFVDGRIGAELTGQQINPHQMLLASYGENSEPSSPSLKETP